MTFFKTFILVLNFNETFDTFYVNSMRANHHHNTSPFLLLSQVFLVEEEQILYKGSVLS